MTSASLGKPGKNEAAGQRPNRILAFLQAHWLSLLILLVVCIFIASNAQRVTVHLVGAHVQARLWLMLLITAGLGFLAGWLFQAHRGRRKVDEADTG
jgi:uncharacterized integral membrane protein